VVLVALLFGITGRLGPGLNEEQVAAQGPVTTATPGTEPAGSSVPPTFGVEPGDTTPATDAPTTAPTVPPSSGVTNPTIVIPPTNPTTVTNPTTPPTTTTPTTAPTTTVPPLTLTIGIIPKPGGTPQTTANLAGQWLMPTRATAGTGPLVAWGVTNLPGGARVEVRGPNTTTRTPATVVVLGTTASNAGFAVCPGQVVVLGAGTSCLVGAGTYDYIVEVFSAANVSLGTQKASIVVV